MNKKKSEKKINNLICFDFFFSTFTLEDEVTSIFSYIYFRRRRYILLLLLTLNIHSCIFFLLLTMVSPMDLNPKSLPEPPTDRFFSTFLNVLSTIYLEVEDTSFSD
ncbi:hypothetical protein RDI58_015329 [Solanum bulbocastanum]|uniref:Transmembrane protein n=1 Tax=Solanum bulbocastanum TaxID=147425 RepID=A0AAN8YBI8_SOLBU